MTIFSALLSLLSNPAVLRGIGYLLIVCGLVFTGYRWGSSEVQEDWDKEKAGAAAALAGFKEGQAKATDTVITEYSKKLAEVESTVKTIYKKVPIYVPADSCPMPAGFRVLHNAAARGELSGTSGSVNVPSTAVGAPGR